MKDDNEQRNRKKCEGKVKQSETWSLMNVNTLGRRPLGAVTSSSPLSVALLGSQEAEEEIYVAG